MSEAETWKALVFQRNEQIASIAEAFGIEQKVGRTIDELVAEIITKAKECAIDE